MSEKIKNYYKHIYSTEKHSEHEWTAGTANPELVNLVYDNKIKPNSNILELGCGLGTESVFLAVRGMNVTAVDISKDAISVGKQLSSLYNVNVDWMVEDILNADFSNYDIVTDQGCFHHLNDDERVIYANKVYKFLKAGGMFILRCFSDEIPGGPQPRRISSDELIDTFHEKFKLDTMTKVLSFSTEQRYRPMGWFTVWYKR
ncbi:Carboxy-S-adenosyl-L-methionine synthase (plasmid) [Apilactobacillus kunkeei]|uniref:class I SAM-dependent methyltransferase n=1 Tax=Apilactobacillus waqarii TaxID=2851006 RepID=UPI0021E2A856|nr:Carboxy-S-adenosyl-L-methionine synthase [Apilactobacillus kunkeei]CAI2672882.1 Carboxy-S-adenosyl-L-methionine synthase [Apilactobacillus kunkeei]CAI2673528.1 Carboxy-S-adenosyl-L-methionine synthase [Apilactobacillus kunkeei]CAI2675219.1 Carboxy-S-adenosyl-L-methionine synthase [Apilactobacillus kunkeei]CAI2675530.1 Carboxy-S-adenosyl-L-methionine synthase [Apilactobacillus kunkeei]